MELRCITFSVCRDMLVTLILASVAGPGDAACAAGILAHTWAEEQGASKQLLPNPSCTTSHLLSSAEPLEPLEPHADMQRLPRLELTIGYIYYCSQHTLSAHAAAWSAWPKHERALLFFLIIDDGSPHRRATAALPPDVHSRLRLAIVRIEQDLPWNIGGARNLIFATAPTEHVLMMDMDVEVPLPLATQLLQLVRLMGSLEKEHGPQILYRFPRLVRTRNGTARNGHPAVMLLRKESYWLAGGCDEDFVGAYGNTDPHFRWRAAKTGKPGTRLLRSIGTIPMRLEPMQQIESGYECPMPPKNSSRNLQLFISKKAGQVAWSAEYLRFTWHVASANTNASHSIFNPEEPDRTPPPQERAATREASAQASGAPTKQATTYFFTVLFDQLDKTVSGGWQHSQMMKLATLSIASSANLNSTLLSLYTRPTRICKHSKGVIPLSRICKWRRFLMQRSTPCAGWYKWSYSSLPFCSASQRGRCAFMWSLTSFSCRAQAWHSGLFLLLAASTLLTLTIVPGAVLDQSTLA